MITAGQIQAARALLGMNQWAFAEAVSLSLSLSTIQRMETSEARCAATSTR